MALLAVSVILHAPRAPASAPTGELSDVRPAPSRTVPARVWSRSRSRHHAVVLLQRHLLRACRRHIRPAAPVVDAGFGHAYRLCLRVCSTRRPTTSTDRGLPCGASPQEEEERNFTSRINHLTYLKTQITCTSDSVPRPRNLKQFVGHHSWRWSSASAHSFLADGVQREGPHGDIRLPLQTNDNV